MCDGRGLLIGPHVQVGGQFRDAERPTRELTDHTPQPWGPGKRGATERAVALGENGDGLEMWEIRNKY